MRINSRFLIKMATGGSILSLLYLLTGCYDEVKYQATNSLDQGNVTLYLPNLSSAAEYGRSRSEGATRAEESELLSNEGRINEEDLWFCAYPQPDSEGQQVVKQLRATDRKSTNTDHTQGYVEYGVSLAKGKYNIYVLANLKDYIQGFDESKLSSEEDVKKLVLNFANFTDKGILKSGENGAEYLPLACKASDIKTGIIDENKVGDNGFEVQEGVSNEIYADLSFLCAKVRYTILFDKSEGGFSKNFPSADIDFEAPTINNLLKETYFFTENSKTLTDDKIVSGVVGELNKVEYPVNTEPKQKKYLDSTEQTVPENLESINNFASGAVQKAWQGIVYIPENLDADRMTNFHFEASGTGVDPDGYDMPAANNPLIFTRAKMYDLIAKLENGPWTVTISVEDWNLEELKYALHGSYDLIVEKTTIDVSSETPAEFFIGSEDGFDPEEIELQSPTIPVEIDGVIEYMPFYVLELFENVSTNTVDGEEPSMVPRATRAGVNDYIVRVSINDDIPYTKVMAHFIEGDKYTGPDDKEYTKTDVNYIHINRGSLHKMIKINLEDVKPILTVSPLEIIIDVKELVESAANSGTIPITYSTNIKDENTQINVTITGGNEGNGGDLIKGGTLELKKGDATFEGGPLGDLEGILNLVINELFSGDPYWNKEHSYTLTFKIEGYSELTKTVTIKVKPYTTDYVIHFAAKSLDHPWTNPHVYVYQVLDLPSDLTGINDQGEEVKLETIAGKTVGFYQGVANGNYSNPLAGLEYCFSNNAGFKGWAGYGGAVTLPTWQDIKNGDVKVESGFVMYQQSKLKDNSIFNPENRNPNIYNYDINLNGSHQSRRDSPDVNAEWVCDICNNYLTARAYNQGNDKNDGVFFAGVAMEKELDDEGNETGWWRYTLSGLATPGKCLIIFFDGHHWEQGINHARTVDYCCKKWNFTNTQVEHHHRYPSKSGENDVAGVPLFDYPDHEGWFVFDGDGEHNRNQNFESEEPEWYENVDVYVRGNFTSLNNSGKWDANPDYQFHEVGPNKWRTITIDIPEGGFFKICDSTENWDRFHLGNNGNEDVYINTPYRLSDPSEQSPDGANLKMNSYFTGYVELVRTIENQRPVFTMTMVPN